MHLREWNLTSVSNILLLFEKSLLGRCFTDLMNQQSASITRRSQKQKIFELGTKIVFESHLILVFRGVVSYRAIRKCFLIKRVRMPGEGQQSQDDICERWWDGIFSKTRWIIKADFFSIKFQEQKEKTNLKILHIK